jgi:hypothetical protein
MGVIIFVTKAEAIKHLTSQADIIRLCKTVVEMEDHTVYVPLAGKLLDLITYFNENSITYELLDGAQYASRH